MSQSVLHNVVCGKKLLRSFSPTNHFTSWLILKDWENRTTYTQEKKQRQFSCTEEYALYMDAKATI